MLFHKTGSLKAGGITVLLLLILSFVSTMPATGQDRNVALNKPVRVSSENPAYPAKQMVDGKISRQSKWEAADGRAPHVVELNLEKYYTISEIRIHSGIQEPEKLPDEKSQAAGFWSVKNFRLQYWDDANWSDLPGTEVTENREVNAVFRFEPSFSTYRLRFICDDGEAINIMEWEVIGHETPNMPSPPGLEAGQDGMDGLEQPGTASIVVKNNKLGNSMKYVGYNQGYYLPGSNASGWVEYSQVNSFRVWTSLNSFVPATAVQVDSLVTTVAEFERRKEALRQNPESETYIKWSRLLPLYDRHDTSSTNGMALNYALSELKRLGVDVILQVGSTDFTDDWANKWKQWQRYYALAYHAARQGNVSMFAMQNEPNHRHSGPMKLDAWITGMQVVSDAIHAAVQDVNKKYGLQLKPRFVGPVTAGQNTDWWAAVSRASQTNYRGENTGHDLLQVFSTHSYNSPASGYQSRISNIRQLIRENHPQGKEFPVVYTEIGRWMNAYLIDKEETMDSPSLFTEWAGIYVQNMLNGGYGMWAFKFANTASSTYTRGIKSGHHFTWQGTRLVEDAYPNIALGARATDHEGKNVPALTDGDKRQSSSWVSDTAAGPKWVELDLGRRRKIGAVVLYSGSEGGVYTAPDRLRKFRLQYKENNSWKDIPGSSQNDNKYAQVFLELDKVVETQYIRLLAEDAGVVRLRELKFLAPEKNGYGTRSFDISGIQRTGQVVRLFAKGFKNERPLYETVSTVAGNYTDAVTTFDAAANRYYVWLVQRGHQPLQVKLDLSDLRVPAGALVTAESVGPGRFGDVTGQWTTKADGVLDLQLPAQSVMLLTISNTLLKENTVKATDAVTVNKRAINNKLAVSLDESNPGNTRLVYAQYRWDAGSVDKAERVLLRMKGKVDQPGEPFRCHVYYIPGTGWKPASINWNNAPGLDASLLCMSDVGQKVHVAGELGFDKEGIYTLDVTEIIRKYNTGSGSFVIIRETRQLGDDADKGRVLELTASPELSIWSK